jgi:hypothetical protein
MIEPGDRISGDIDGSCNLPHRDLAERTAFLLKLFYDLKDEVLENAILAGFQYEVSVISPGKGYAVGDILDCFLFSSDGWSIYLRVTSVSPDGGVLSLEIDHTSSVTAVVNHPNRGTFTHPPSPGLGCRISISSTVDKRYILREVDVSLRQAMDLLRHDTLVNEGYVNYIGSQVWVASQASQDGDRALDVSSNMLGVYADSAWNWISLADIISANGSLVFYSDGINTGFGGVKPGMVFYDYHYNNL